MPVIEQNLTNVNYKSRGTNPSWIVIHNTGNDTAEPPIAHNNTIYFKNTNRSASATFFIDNGDTIWQCVRETDTAWHCGESASRNGCRNYNSIGIEVCEPSNGKFTAKEIENLKWLVNYLMNKYGIDRNHICRHNDVTGKDCPWYYVNNSHWNELMSQILDSSYIAPDASPAPYTPEGGIAVDGWWGPATTRALQSYLGTPVDGIISNQFLEYRSENPGLCDSSFEWNDRGRGGSACIKALQRKIGVTDDGYIGPNTIRALQRYLGTYVDGCISGPSACVRALQTALNNNSF